MFNQQKNNLKIIGLFCWVWSMVRLLFTHLLPNLAAILKKPAHIPSGILFTAFRGSREAFIHKLLCLSVLKHLKLPKGLTEGSHLYFA